MTESRNSRGIYYTPKNIENFIVKGYYSVINSLPYSIGTIPKKNLIRRIVKASHIKGFHIIDPT